MRPFMLNILLALIWTAITGEFTLLNLLSGLVIGFVVLALADTQVKEYRPAYTERRMLPMPYYRKVGKIIGLIGYFLYALVEANIRVAIEIITPKFYMTPGVVAIPLDVTSDAEITLLANVITLTPGTLSLDVSDDRKFLYVHAMYIKDGDVEKFRQEIKDGFERRIMEVFA